MRRLILTTVLCLAVGLLGLIPALAQEKSGFRTEDYLYSTLEEYERVSGKKITSFTEAPMFRTMVAAGELPPVEERLPKREDILVIKPVEQVGKYGGTLKKIEAGGASGIECYTINSNIVRQNVEFTKVMPDLAKKVEFSKDYKTLNILLRNGLRWSDGYPFTVDDILFWWEDQILNDDLTPVKPKAWMPGGELAKFEKIDDYTLRIHFAIPSPYIKFKLARFWQAGVQGNFFDPKHYLKKWHIKYNPEADELAKEEGYEHWWDAYWFHKAAHVWGKDINLPKVGPYIRERITTTERVYIRNPYYHAVDTEGNQLPYIDRIINYLSPQAEVGKMKAIAGELDFYFMGPTLLEYPLYKENEEKGGYRTILMIDTLPTGIVIGFNQNHPDPVKSKIFQDLRFRQAMSLALNREEMNEVVYFGKGKPMQPTAHPSSTFYKPEWGEANPYLRYDADEANRLLDEVGLDRQDAEGWRLRPDGKRLTIFIQYAYTGAVPATEILELVKEYWEDVKVKTEMKMVEYGYYYAWLSEAKHDVGVWAFDANFEGQLYTWPIHKLEFGSDMVSVGLKWDKWIDTEGEEGVEPPGDVKQWYRWIDEWLTYAPGTPKYMEFAELIFDWYSENLWEIGTVGMAPRPVLLSKNIRNARLEGGYFGWDSGYHGPYLPVQWYFEK